MTSDLNASHTRILPQHEAAGAMVSLVKRERQVLEQIAAGTPLAQVLEDLLLAVEAQSAQRMLTSVLLLSEDGAHLRHGAAPSLPQTYNEAIDGIVLGEGVGSCGTAARRGSAVYVSDIGTDPLWADFKDLAAIHGLRACWSTPIMAAGGQLLGTFAIYYGEVRTPTADDIKTISLITQTAALAIERDASDRKLLRAQDELRCLNEKLVQQVEARTEERDLFATMVESTDVMIMAFDMAYNILAINRANADEFERVLGRRPQIGDNVLALLADQPLHQAQVRAGLGRGLSGEDVTFIEAYGNPARDRPFYEIKFRPLRNAQGERIGCYQFVTDVTARLREQAEHAQTQEALRQSQKMEAVGQLTGGVAHDFNNLLTVIRSSVDLLKRPNVSEERRVRYVDAISTTVDRAARLTSQLLAFARRQALTPEVFDACESVRVIGDMLGTLTGSRIAVETTLAEGDCFIDADPSQFDTALVNLGVNARDAMNGQGRLFIGVSPVAEMPAIRAHSAVVGAFVAVTIGDTGCGIPARELEHIFEPFFTTKAVGQGTGLGLSQVYGFAKQSGGEIMVSSEVGRGTTFTLYLPRAQPTGVRDVRGAEPVVDGHGTCVLVVEDNKDVGAFTAQALNELGYRVTWAEDAEAALRELATDASRFDIVFTDVVMPGMDGVELARRIRQVHDDLPVVLTSGYSHVLAQNGTHGFELLRKPYSIEQLSRVLGKVLSWRQDKRSTVSREPVIVPGPT